MVLASKELSIRGDISTTVDYIFKLIEVEDYVENRFDTGWLDALIKANMDGIVAAENLVSKKTVIPIKSVGDHTCVPLQTTMAAFDVCSGESPFLPLLEKGQLPPQNCLSVIQDVELILNGIKYILTCTRTGPNSFDICLTTDKSMHLSTNVRMLSDGRYLIDIGGKSHIVYLTTKGDVATGMKMNVGGKTVAFSTDYDPTCLRTETLSRNLLLMMLV